MTTRIGTMALDPLQLFAALIAACLVLAISRATESLDRKWRYSLRSLLIIVTGIALVLGLVSVAIHK
jgi:hypothetical protein